MAVYVVRAEYGKYTNAFKVGGFCGIGWMPDEKLEKTTDKETLLELFKTAHPEDTQVKMRAVVNIGQILRFISEISIGDYIITPYESGNPMLLIGKIVGDVYQEKTADFPYVHRRKVDWLPKELDRKEFSIPLQNTLKSSLTCFSVRQESEILEKIGDKSYKTSNISEKILSPHENIRRKFLELDALEFEQLISYVLQTLGFEASQKTGKVGDGGIDYEGVLDVIGVASIKLQVQVKRYDSNTIKESDIRNFRGALKTSYQGCFISLSNFAEKAYTSASDPDRTPINIIDGKKFVDIFIEQYDKIMDAIYADDNDFLAHKLKFKKTLLPL